MPRRKEFVPDGVAIYRGEKMQDYQCPTCLRPVFTSYEGDEPARKITCNGYMRGHVVIWDDEEDQR